MDIRTIAATGWRAAKVILAGLALIASGIAFGAFLEDEIRTATDWKQRTVAFVSFGLVLALCERLVHALRSVTEYIRTGAAGLLTNDAIGVFFATVGLASAVFALADPTEPEPTPVASAQRVVFLDRPVPLGGPERLAVFPVYFPDEASALEPAPPGREYARNVEPQHRAVLAHLLTELASCVDPVRGLGVAFEVVGYASSSEFPTNSEAENLEVANDRAKSAEAVITDLLGELRSSGAIDDQAARLITAETVSWSSHDEMVRDRGYEDRKGERGEYSVGRGQLNRRADIRLNWVGACERRNIRAQVPRRSSAESPEVASR